MTYLFRFNDRTSCKNKNNYNINNFTHLHFDLRSHFGFASTHISALLVIAIKFEKG